jgi:hypothetical protein
MMGRDIRLVMIETPVPWSSHGHDMDINIDICIAVVKGYHLNPDSIGHGRGQGMENEFDLGI